MTEAVARSGRLSADDWAREALEQIAETGVASVAVEPLARRLGVTKGSFYWHFPSRDALLQAALERWETMEQELVFGSLEKVTDPRERLRALFQLVAHDKMKADKTRAVVALKAGPTRVRFVGTILGREVKYDVLVEVQAKK